MIYFGSPDWDGFGRLVMAVGLAALLAYLAPGMIALTPSWRRRMQIAAGGLLAAALILALAAAVLWFSR